MSLLSFFKSKKEKIETSENEISQTKLKRGIVFSGGGVRGFAYVGVIKALKEAGIDFDMVAGTSVGSLIGALYANEMPVKKMEELAVEIRQSDITSSKLFFVPSKTERLETLVKSLVGDATFETLKKPFCVVAVDLKSGKEMRITQGDLVKAIAGSCAIPGVFTPVEFDDTLIVDGGLVNNMPADALRDMGADIIVSIDINPTRGNGTDSTKTLDVLKAALRILMVSNVVGGYVHSDYVLKIDLSDFSQLKVGDTKSAIQKGYEETKKHIPEILQAISKTAPDESIKKVSRKLKAIQKKQLQIEKLKEKLTEEEKQEFERNNGKKGKNN